MEKLFKEVVEGLFPSQDFEEVLLIEESFIHEDMKDFFDEQLYYIQSEDMYIYLFNNKSNRKPQTVVVEFFKIVLNLKERIQDANIKFFLVEEDKIIEFEKLILEQPISLEKYSPDFDYIFADFQHSNDEVLKREIKLKIFSEMIKFIYKDEELKGLLRQILSM